MCEGVEETLTIADAVREAGTLLCYALGRERAFLVTHSDESPTPGQLAHICLR